MNNLIDRITLNPEICHGKPTIRNKRYTVDLILDLLTSGMTDSEILDDYPTLEKEDIMACLAYAAKLTNQIICENCMKFLIDVQLPPKLCEILESIGLEIHSCKIHYQMGMRLLILTFHYLSVKTT
jgi:uncharacterized protein (DUF433 family)